ncbi:MAG: hypothetical protein JXR83_08550 [Deltaproteobacteria bacterium]|nr:hypothetical protein [Deltaproteobacteria bacterium]
MLASLLAAFVDIAFVAATATATAASAPALPAWADFEKERAMDCWAPFDARARPLERKIGTAVFRLEGSRLTRLGTAPKKIAIGLLSAIKEAEPDTLENLSRAKAAFDKAGVDLIVANGDVALEEFDLEKVMSALGQTGYPVLLLIGNSESRGAFNRAFVAAEKKHPNLFHLGWVRHVELGPIDLVSLPGYHDRNFMPQSAGCRYKQEQVDELSRFVAALSAQQKTAVLIGHGPPRSRGAGAIDRAFEAGNVGDPMLTTLIEERAIRYGLFGHILEAGGRATTDLAKGTPARPGQRHKTLFVNAGAASATPWTMLDGKASQGLAMIVSFAGDGASYRVVKLRQESGDVREGNSGR